MTTRRMNSLLSRFKGGASVWDTDLPYVIEILTARMEQYVSNVDGMRWNVLQQLRAIPVHRRTLSQCCEVVLNNI